MENILEIGSINRDSGNSQLPVFNHQDFPLRLCDIIVPQCNTGFVYMLVSVNVNTFTYIGETGNIHARLIQHNSGYGSQTTCTLSLRPYSLFCICMWI